MSTEEIPIAPDLYKMAIEAIEAATKIHKIKFIIKGPTYSHWATRYSKKWQVLVMGKNFTNENFLQACGDAIQFVVEAHKDKYIEEI